MLQVGFPAGGRCQPRADRIQQGSQDTAPFVIPTYFGQLLMMAISIVLVAIGVAIYMDVKLVNMPMEGMTLAISDCFPNI